MTPKERQKDQRLRKTYGITLEDHTEMRSRQNYQCYICNVSETETNLCVDHIHQLGFKKMGSEEKKKYIRGLLCYMCNTGIKGFDKTKSGTKNRQRLEGTIRYFNEFKLKGEL